MTMPTAPLTADQRDALQEVVNIALGQAASALAKLLDTYVTLSIPVFHDIPHPALVAVLSTRRELSAPQTVVNQSFAGQLRGELPIPVLYDGVDHVVRWSEEARAAWVRPTYKWFGFNRSLAIGRVRRTPPRTASRRPSRP